MNSTSFALKYSTPIQTPVHPHFDETQHTLIQSVFTAYCLQKNLHLATKAQALLLKKLTDQLQTELATHAGTDKALNLEQSFFIDTIRLHCRALLKNNDAEDIALLHDQPMQLVLKYQPMIAYVVHKQTANSQDIDTETKEDLVANIQAKLLQKTANDKLAKQYKGNALFSTYLYRVIYYNLIDELRQVNRHQKTSVLKEEAHLPQVSQYSQRSTTHIQYIGVIEQHLKRFSTLLKILGPKKRKRFEFALKIVYRMSLNAADIRGLYPHCSDELLVEILSYFGKAYHELPKTTLHQLIYDFILLLENEDEAIKADSFRTWFQIKLHKIKNALFIHLPKADKTSLDDYFELLMYKFYKKK